MSLPSSAPLKKPPLASCCGCCELAPKKYGTSEDVPGKPDPHYTKKFKIDGIMSALL
jgi:hypothetical protein